MTAATRANSYQDLQTILNGVYNNIATRKWAVKWDNVSSEDAADMTWGDITHSQMYIRALKDQMEAKGEGEKNN